MKLLQLLQIIAVHYGARWLSDSIKHRPSSFGDEGEETFWSLLKLL